jgi:hypothetical protein
MRIPINRIVAFFGPAISLFSGGVAAWLTAKVNVLGIPGLGQAGLATQLAAGVSGTLTAGLLALGQLKWLKGHHIELAAEGQVQAAAIAAPGDPHDTLLADDEDLPSDDDEFAAPPPDDDPPPVVQASQAPLEGEHTP